uniref:Uncharacterized protein n=1 Tax=Onchocerca volvulus TaxID=6282 RepID=A0A8R1Y5P8_ONCVO
MVTELDTQRKLLSSFSDDCSLVVQWLLGCLVIVQVVARWLLSITQMVIRRRSLNGCSVVAQGIVQVVVHKRLLSDCSVGAQVIAR